MALPYSTKMLQVCHVPPFTASPESKKHFSLPLTYFDTFWFRFFPVKRVFFYSLPETKNTFFNSVLPNLKHSLSLTLHYFLPLAGKLTWPQDSPKPLVLYTPGDVVSVSIAESDADFDLLTSNNAFPSSFLSPLVSSLHVSETGASVIALQITVFPNHGFSIGITAHHAVLDGKSSMMFFKSWAYLSKQNPPLLPELTPFYDRTVIKDPSGFDMKFLNYWIGNPGSTSSDCRNNPKLSKPELQLSSFVLTYAYVFYCIIKATEGDESKRKVILGFVADYRNRLTPPVPENYFGNCVRSKFSDDMREQMHGSEEDSLTSVVAKTSGLVKELGKEKDFKKEEELLLKMTSKQSEISYFVGVAGSPKFGFYGIDFGWGRPKKVSVVSLSNGSISMAECRDGNGGVEVGLVLEKYEMDVFGSVFVAGLSTNIP
ncbi:hypothetical protein CsatA_017077 [Cannabis sativa]